MSEEATIPKKPKAKKTATTTTAKPKKPKPVAKPKPVLEVPVKVPGVRWVKIEEVMSRYSIDRTTVDRWIAREAFPEPVTFGIRLRLWNERELDEFDALKKKTRDSAKGVRRSKRIEREERETMKARGETEGEAVPVPVASP